MSKILDKALERAKTLLSDDRQDEIGEMIDAVIDQEQSDLQLSPSQQEELRRRMADPDPVFATDDQVEAFFANSPCDEGRLSTPSAGRYP